MVGRYEPRRRELIASFVTACLGGVAGCSGSGDDVQDSDDDGIVDSEDYAPNDPAVQEKSDVVSDDEPTQSTTEHSTDTPTETATDTPTETATDTPTETATDTPTETATAAPIPAEGVELVNEISYRGGDTIQVDLTFENTNSVPVEVVPTVHYYETSARDNEILKRDGEPKTLGAGQTSTWEIDYDGPSQEDIEHVAYTWTVSRADEST